MEYPILSVKAKTRQMQDTFLGYNHKLRIGDGEFYDMKNLTSDHYPVLAPRGPRGIYAEDVQVTGLIAKDVLCYTDGSAFVIGDERIEMGLSDERKQLISMGAYVIILPDKKWINTQCRNDDGSFNAENGTGDIEQEHQAVNVFFSLCKANGEDYEDLRPGEKPAETEGAVWFDTSAQPPCLKVYSETTGMWNTVATTYLKLSGEGIGAGLELYDGVTISGIADGPYGHLNGSHALWGCGEDYIIITGIPYGQDDQAMEDPYDLTVSRKMPAMDFVVESGNRLWGCRYGMNNDGEPVNEIYASKLGDFKNWSCFMNLSTDSYAVSCGTDGPFTGAITHLGFPLFFKEECVHKVYGDYPSNFRVQNTACRGVQKGSGGSLAIVGETLFYKGRNGVCAYDGSLPVEMSAELGEVHYSEAAACAHGNKYYICMKAPDGESHLFVYDSAKGMWHKEDGLYVDSFCSYGNDVYGIARDTKQIITMLGSGTPEEEAISWMAESGLIGMSLPDRKYISRLLLRLSLEEGAQVRVYLQYDSLGDWEQVTQVSATSLRSFAIPIRPRRCDHFRIRIEGEGDGRIFSVTRTIEQGSDVL